MKTVTVTGVDDSDSDGDVSYSIITQPAESLSPAYNGIDAADVSLVNRDNDIAANVRVSGVPLGGLQTSEQGATATFRLRLTRAPRDGATVTITLAADDASEAVVEPSSVVFTDVNFDQEQTIEVNYLVVIAPAGSVGDPAYDGIGAAALEAINADDGRDPVGNPGPELFGNGFE